MADGAKALSILHLEDNPADASLIQLMVTQEIPASTIEHVETAEAYCAALQAGGYDLILSDYRMPQYDGDQALKYARDNFPDLPFIMVTGELGEDRAIETLKRGATDYVLKDNLKRLVPSIRRALEEAEAVRQRRQAEKKLQETVGALASANEELYERERVQRVLARIGDLASRSTATGELIEAIGCCMADELGVSRCGLSRIDLGAEEVTVTHDYHSGFPSLAGTLSLKAHPDYYMNDGRAGRTVCIEDIASDVRTAAVYERQYAPIHVRAHLTVPLLRDGQWAANFWVSHHEPRHWTAQDIRLMQAAAERVWTAAERIEAEEALRKSEARFRSYFQLGLIGVAITSPAKSLLDLNDEFCRIVGYERSELLQMSWVELTYPDDLSLDVAQHNRVMAGEIDAYSLDKRWVRKDGRIIDSRISVRCLRRTDGSVEYFVALVQDITDQKQAIEELARFNRAAVDRELRMIELKQEVNDLCMRNGRPPRYPLEFMKHGPGTQ